MSDKCEIYLLTPDRIDLTRFPDMLAQVLDAAPVAAVQLRLKGIQEAELQKAIEVLCPIVQQRDIAFILNDRPDLAVKMGCDGAHIGLEDGNITQARNLLENMQLGVSCYGSRHQAMQAGEVGADYVAFGPFFPSPSKEGEVVADTSLLKWWSTLMELPCVAIGGITAENCAPLIENGADFLAVISAVWNHPQGPEQGIKTLYKTIQAI